MTSTSSPTLIPREVLFGNPTRVAPAISPDGKRLAYLAPDEGVLNVWVGTVGGDDFHAVTKDRDRGIQGYFWAHDNRHLLYVQDKAGDENWRIYDVDLDTGDIRDLTPFENVQARIEQVNKRFPNEILVSLNKDNPQLHDVYHLDLTTGELELRAKNEGFIGWVVDAQLQVRCAVQPRPDGSMVVMVRDTADSPWREVMTFPAEDALGSSPWGFTLDGSALYVVSSLGVNAARLVRLDLASGDVEVIAEDPVYDVGTVLIHPDSREVQMVGFVKDRIEYQVLDASIEEDVAALRALHSGDMGFVGRDHSDRIWLVAFTADDGPVPYYSFDRDTKEATFLFDHRPELKSYELAKMEPFSFTARDGLTVHGYATFPPGVDKRNLPAVLNVHGGPWARDMWGFNPEAQWLANRGYLCVQVNFRGSTGYGKDFLNAGDKEWGAKMHDDLLDAVEYIVAQGWADREKIGIYGGSYGGYAALVGAAFTPDVFCCAVDQVGPSNLKTLIESIPPYWAPMVVQFHNRVGNPETEADFLWERSPLSKADNIRIPLLISQGANDPRVKQAESEQIVAALRDKGIEHEYLLFEDEGHGNVKPENRMKFYASTEQFLARVMGGQCEEPPSEVVTG